MALDISSIGDANAYRQAGVFREVAAERDRQDSKWGGPDHDDEHEPEDWLIFIEQRAARAGEMIGCPEEEQPEIRSDAEYRRQLVQIAALAIAAVESLDRKKAATP